MRHSGFTRRGFLLSAGVVAGAAAGGAIVWREYFDAAGPDDFASSGGPGSGRSRVIPSKPLALLPSGRLLDTDFPDPFAGGECLGHLPFAGEGDRGTYEPGRHIGEGHDARQIIDLASLFTPDGRKTPSDAFYIRTEYPDKLRAPEVWTIDVGGAVAKPGPLRLDSLEGDIEPKGSVLLECSGNGRPLRYGLLSVADWDGVSIERFLRRAAPKSKARWVLVNGYDEHTHISNHSKPTCSWIFPLDKLVGAGAFFATRMNGRPLPAITGPPLRLVVPGWYGCTEVKWVNEVKFFESDQPVTLQMIEFAGRTLQDGSPERAAEYRPATIDQVAMPVRVEQWRLNGKLAYRVIGITWGGSRRTDKLKIRFGAARGRGQFEPVEFCAAKTSNPEYGIWFHRWEPKRKGGYWIDVRLDARGVSSRKMELREPLPNGSEVGFYERGVVIPAV